MYSVDLIEMLNKDVPPKCPGINDSEREIWLYAGKRALVEGLLSTMKEQTDENGGLFPDVL